MSTAPPGPARPRWARQLADRTGAQLIHGDDLMAGWRGLDAVGRQLADLVSALAEGRPGSYEHFDWLADRYDRTVEVPPAPWLVVEGVGSGAAALAAYITVLVWVEVDDDLRLARGLERDGDEQGSSGGSSCSTSGSCSPATGIRERADVVVDGTGRRPPVVR